MFRVLLLGVVSPNESERELEEYRRRRRRKSSVLSTDEKASSRFFFGPKGGVVSFCALRVLVVSTQSLSSERGLCEFKVL